MQMATEESDKGVKNDSWNIVSRWALFNLLYPSLPGMTLYSHSTSKGSPLFLFSYFSLQAIIDQVTQQSKQSPLLDQAEVRRAARAPLLLSEYLP
jgi:hypothetical protein